MYGLINKSLRAMILERFGEETWDKVLRVSEVPHDSFLTMRSYDDSVTYRLAGAVSSVLETPLADCLEMFGEYWMQRTAPQNYGDLLTYTGTEVLGFFDNLNSLHDHITTTFMGYRPPSFDLQRNEDGTVTLRYRSVRTGLTPFVRGLVRGIGQRFDTPIEILSVETSGGDEGEESLLRLRVG